MKKPKTKLQLNTEIAGLIVKHWPEFKSQQFFADKLQVSQTQISRRLKNWNINYPMKIEEPDERDKELEVELMQLFNLGHVTVLKNKEVHIKSYYEQIGMHASEILVNAIPGIIDKRESLNNEDEYGSQKKLTLRIAGSDGNNVLSCISCLVNDLTSTNMQIEIMPTIALRSRRLVELSPAHSMSQLLNINPNIAVTDLYQLPEIEINDYKQMEHLVKQRIITVHRLKFNYNLCKRDIVVLDVENIKRNFFGNGFPNFVSDLGLSDIIRKLDIHGVLSFSPFNTEYGFLFHYLRNKVFAPKYKYSEIEVDIEDWEFKHNMDEQIDLLKKIAVVEKSIGEKELFAAAKLFCSIFTLNVCKFEQFTEKNNDGIKPYVLIVAGGASQKANPLQYILNRVKYDKNSIVDGLVTSSAIAEKILEINKKQAKKSNSDKT